MDYFTVWNVVDWCSIIVAYTLLGTAHTGR